MQTTAVALNQSTRTLGRRLMDEGTTFHQIKDALRRDVAVQMLAKTRKSVDTISAAIGFSNITVFHRAFKTWTGGTPRSYRRNQLGRVPKYLDTPATAHPDASN
jgi:AraC-like DNA-binding protein